jgi:hypothetical protein
MARPRQNPLLQESLAASGDATVTGGLHRRLTNYADVRTVPSMRHSRQVQEVRAEGNDHPREGKNALT